MWPFRKKLKEKLRKEEPKNMVVEKKVVAVPLETRTSVIGTFDVTIVLKNGKTIITKQEAFGHAFLLDHTEPCITSYSDYEVYTSQEKMEAYALHSIFRQTYVVAVDGTGYPIGQVVSVSPQVTVTRKVVWTSTHALSRDEHSYNNERIWRREEVSV